ncbi:MAG: hypothetical protein WDN09_01575 [bacterium]
MKSDLLPFISIHTLQWNIFAMLVVEMIKNIYDHAEGVGYARLRRIRMPSSSRSGTTAKFLSSMT